MGEVGPSTLGLPRLVLGTHRGCQERPLPLRWPGVAQLVVSSRSGASLGRGWEPVSELCVPPDPQTPVKKVGHSRGCSGRSASLSTLPGGRPLLWMVPPFLSPVLCLGHARPRARLMKTWGPQHAPLRWPAPNGLPASFLWLHLPSECSPWAHRSGKLDPLGLQWQGPQRGEGTKQSPPHTHTALKSHWLGRAAPA